MSIEDFILSQPSPATGGIASPAAPAVRVSPSLACRQPDHRKSECALCAQFDLEEARTALEVVKAQPATPAPAPGPVTAAPTADPTSPAGLVLLRASELAQAIDRCTKLNTRIAGLECSLEAARKEQIEADAAKDAAQEALKKLVVQ